MKKYLEKFLKGWALAGALIGSFVTSAAVAGEWFYEDADSFQANTKKAWSYDPSVASRSGDRIVITAASDGSVKTVDYHPDAPGETTSATLTDVISFTAPGTLSADGSGSVAGIQIVETSVGSGSYVFAVYNPASGAQSWIKTAVSAELGVDYHVRLLLDCQDGYESLTYAVRRASETDFQYLACVTPPAGVQLPTELSYGGAGTLTSVTATSSDDGLGHYDKWAYATAIMTWRGEATSMVGSYAKFTQFKKGADGSWADDSSQVWIASQKYNNQPGYSGTTLNCFYYVFDARSQNAARGYSAPGYTLRFVPDVGKDVMTVAWAYPFKLSGILVEPGCGSRTYYSSSTSLRAVHLGDERGSSRARFEFNSDFTINVGYKTGSEVRFFGPCDLYVADECYFGINTTNNANLVKIPVYLDSKTRAELNLQGNGTFGVSTLVATGTVTLSFAEQDKSLGARITGIYSKQTGTDVSSSVGNLTVDKDTTICFPAGVAEDEKYPLCTGTLTILSTSSSFKCVRVGSESVLATIAYDAATKSASYHCSDRNYARWSSCADRIVTWRGKGSVGDSISTASSGARYRLFDTTTYFDGTTEYAGSEKYETLPGYAGSVPYEFWRIFSSDQACWNAPGVVLRFKPYVSGDAVGALTAAYSPFTLGGLIVEPSAASGSNFYSLTSDLEDSMTELGDARGDAGEQTWFDVQENFKLARNGATKLLGSLTVEIAEGKELDLNTSYPAQPVTLEAASAAKLSMRGQGTLLVSALTATGDVTLDYSALEVGRASPFISGGLSVSEKTRFKLPAGAASGYVLCSGTLVAPATSTLELLTVGDLTFYANVTFDTVSRAIIWTTATVNAATVSSDRNWSSLWGAGWSAGAPVAITLNGPAILTVDTDAYAFDHILFSGAYACGLAYTAEHTLPSVSVGGGASYSTYLVGGLTRDAAVVWNGPLTLDDDYTIRNCVKATLATEGLRGRLAVESGATFENGADDALSFDGAPAVDVYGTLDLARTRWTLGSRVALSLYGGSTTTGMGHDGAALDVWKMPSISVHSYSGNSTATLSALMRFRSDGGLETFKFDIDAGATLLVKNSEFAYQGSVALEIGPGTLAFAGGDYALNVATNAGTIKVQSGTTVTIDGAGREGKVEVAAGGTLRLKISAEHLVDGYIAENVTLASGNSIVFVGPDGTEYVGTDNVLVGTATIWTGTGDGTSWNDRLNWSAKTVPTAGMQVIVRDPATITLGDPAPVAGTLNIRADVLLQGGCLVPTIQTNLVDGGTLSFGEGTFDFGTLALTNGAVLSTTYETALETDVRPESLFIKKGDGKLAIRGSMAATDIRIDAGTLAFDETGDSVVTGHISGEGFLRIGGEAIVDLTEATLDEALGGFSGDGIVAIARLPVNAIILNQLTNALTWTGTTLLRGVELNGFDPSQYGSEKSKVGVSGCRGYFDSGAIVVGTTVCFMKEDAYENAFELTQGYDGGKIEFRQATGSGRICLKETAVGVGGTQPRYRVFFPSGSAFAGSLAITGDANRGGFVVGCGISDSSEPTSEGDGAILVEGASAQLASGATWSAVRGIAILQGGVLTDAGALESPVRGTGSVRYTGTIGSQTIETAAAYTADDWRGTVWLDSARIDGAQLNLAGNSQSVIRMNACRGYLASMTIPASVELVGSDALVIDGGEDSSVAEFARLCGSGSLVIPESTSSTSYYRILDASAHQGGLQVLGTPSVGIGAGTQRSAAGSIDFADGCQIQSRNDWRALTASFGATLRVIGNEGDAIMSITGKSQPDFDTLVTLSGGGNPRQNYALRLNGDTKELFIVGIATPPSMTISDPVITYGADLTNATISVTVSDFSEGVDFTGGVSANYEVRDASGKLIATGGTWIDGDGVWVLGTADLGVSGGDFTFTVTVQAMEKPNADPVEVLGVTTAGSSVRTVGSWIDETAATFPTAASDKTGDWSWSRDPSQLDPAFVEENAIRIDTVASAGDDVLFTARQPTASEVTKIDFDLLFNAEGCVRVLAEDTGDVLAGLRLNEGSFEVWSAGANQFVPVSNGSPAATNRSCAVALILNRLTDAVTYCVDGWALTNATGDARFALASSAAANRLSFGGNLTLSAFAGENCSASVARMNAVEYRSVDLAVQDAAEDATVEILWPATWRPTKADVGKRIVFTGAELTIDEAASANLIKDGYEVRALGGGAYRVDVISYQLTFAANGGGGTPYAQAYTATNCVFALRTNEFVRTGFDFAAWNLEPDGSGNESWTNSATIDMTRYGLTNATLYAQWKVATRTIVIEPADEFVYFECAYTNDVTHSGVRFFQSEASTGRGSVKFAIQNGASLTVRFSTDLEKSLDRDPAISYVEIDADKTIEYALLPKILNPLNSVSSLTPIQRWANARGIASSALAASPYAESSYALNTASLLTKSTIVSITDFVVVEDGCSFKVSIDGRVLDDCTALAEMIRVSTDLKSWASVSPGAITCDGETVTVVTEKPGSFVKIVIPEDSEN